MTGGDITFATKVSGKGFTLTGQLGDVMKRVQAALGYIRSRAERYNIDPDFFAKSDIHLHIPLAQFPKMGRAYYDGSCTRQLLQAARSSPTWA